MAFKKGKPKTGGKKKGVPNKITRDIKEAYRQLIENNLDNLTGWLEKIAEKDPEKAIRIISDLSEYIIPKLARTDLTGKIKQDIKTTLVFKDYKNGKS
jgi:hypothetical protein